MMGLYFLSFSSGTKTFAASKKNKKLTVTGNTFEFESSPTNSSFMCHTLKLVPEGTNNRMSVLIGCLLLNHFHEE